jgi:hypothetical protein
MPTSQVSLLPISEFDHPFATGRLKFAFRELSILSPSACWKPGLMSVKCQKRTSLPRAVRFACLTYRGNSFLSLLELTKGTTRRVEDDEVGEDIERIGLTVAVVDSPGCAGKRSRACGDRIPEGTR